ncbi:hypothetical protein [Streptomyces sp. NEAU-W12]|uniref:hypothetical protein n=1 Tax=Streptomyces sp. NEAU-W12 TaxID=2994668 RepID=UPI00224A7630|nr:hypothetical protein [Streptomyces sp. NEAU-W12]MCX2926055.1 hypothetical protein [Streptomyces sp. NEAU-W12]
MIDDTLSTGATAPATLTTCQDMSGAFRQRSAMRVTADVALLDACAELGELAGAYLKQCRYAPSGANGLADSPPSDRVRAEFGDALFALLSFADAAGLDSEAEFFATLKRYEERFTDERSGSGTDDRRG